MANQLHQELLCRHNGGNCGTLKELLINTPSVYHQLRPNNETNPDGDADGIRLNLIRQLVSSKMLVARTTEGIERSVYKCRSAVRMPDLIKGSYHEFAITKASCF